MTNTIASPDLNSSRTDTWQYPAGNDSVSRDTAEVQQSHYADYLAAESEPQTPEQTRALVNEDTTAVEASGQSVTPNTRVPHQPSPDELRAKAFSAYDSSAEALAARAEQEQAAQFQSAVQERINFYGPGLEKLRKVALERLN